MSDSENWRTETNALEYFGHQKKKNTLADRRPVIRKPSDLVGPGIGAQAVPIEDFNDVLVTFNGFYSDDGSAVNGPLPGSGTVGYVISDAVVGGVQVFYSTVGDGFMFERRFLRNPSDPNKIYWQPWYKFTGTPV